MRFYRVKDKKTGLYYRPVRSIVVMCPDGKKRYIKSNLSAKAGKVYNNDPRRHIRGIDDHTDIEETARYPGWKAKCRPVNKDDLELELIIDSESPKG